jgi:transcriptional regulator with PAS, ATPase and Fis domain
VTRHLLTLQDTSLLQHKAMQSMFDCFESLCEGTVIIDRAAKVVWINDRYAARLRIDPVKAIGQEIEAIIPNSLMRRVVETGEPILIDLLEASEQTFVVMRMPVKDEDGAVLGAVGFALFSHYESLKPLFERFSRLQSELARAHKKLAAARRTKYTFSSFIGDSPATMEVKRLARRAAMLHAPVLLQGETGTGKELLAHAIHAGGPRADQPFVSVNMAAVPETLLEAEFFGVAPGAYTGADRKPRPGKFELAHGGTLFLDEIGDLPLPLQSKLLRVLQEHECEPLGSNRVIRVDVRILAATSRDLEAMVAEGRFRKDLFYRLNVLDISMPPLRDRAEDIPLLFLEFAEQCARASGEEPPAMPEAFLASLLKYPWPGNVRELQNVAEKYSVLCRLLDHEAAAGLVAEALKPDLEDAACDGASPDLLYGSLADIERRAVRAAFEAEGCNLSRAAKRLGIDRQTLRNKLNP